MATEKPCCERLAERLEGTEQEERDRRIMAEAALEEASALIKTLKSGTEPLTDEETRALLLMEPSGPLPENGHEARAVASARSKLRARLARADG